jgi:hypothetical protein
MGLKTRRPPKKEKGAKKAAQDAEEETKDAATASTAAETDTDSISTEATQRGMEELKSGETGTVVGRRESLADRLSAEGIIATFSQVCIRTARTAPFGVLV